MQITLFISGLGLLLYAMRMLEQTVAKLGEGRLRQALEVFTRSPLHGIVLGIVITAILQSSTVVGLITMAFVGAGVLPFRNAIGVILGCNLGTTFTGWLVTYLGFTLDLDAHYAILLGLAALVAVLTKDGSRYQHAAYFVFSYGLLLFGLVLMKDSISFVVELVDVTRLQSFPLPVFFVFGALLTALLHSSSATVAITLSALSAGILDLNSAAALVIGADLGTTSTVVMSSFSGPVIKRRIGLVHLMFNVVTDVTALVCLPLLLKLISDVFNINDPLFALVAIHSSFNFFGILLFFPFIGLLQKFVEQRVPLPATHNLRISQVSDQVPAAALQALEQDVRDLLIGSILLNGWRLQLPETQAVAARRLLLPETVDMAYTELKQRENQLTDYILKVQSVNQDPAQSSRLQQLLVCIRDCLYSTKAVKDVGGDIQTFRQLGNKAVAVFLEQLLQVRVQIYAEALALLETDARAGLDQVKSILDRIRQSHTRSNVLIYELIESGDFQKDRASTALNINRELLFSGHSLVNAIEHYLLPPEQARTVSEILNLRT
jgi:phosphate:Na+ symporter